MRQFKVHSEFIKYTPFLNSVYSQFNSPGESLFLLTSLQNLTKNIFFLSFLYLGIISLAFEAVPEQALPPPFHRARALLITRLRLAPRTASRGRASGALAPISCLECAAVGLALLRVHWALTHGLTTPLGLNI